MKSDKYIAAAAHHNADAVFDFPRLFMELVASLGDGQVLAQEAQQLVGRHGLDVEAREQLVEIAGELLAEPEADLAPCARHYSDFSCQ